MGLSFTIRYSPSSMTSMAMPVTPMAPWQYRDFSAIGCKPRDKCRAIWQVACRGRPVFTSLFLLRTVPEKLRVPANVLSDVLRILAPIKIVAMRQSVIQDSLYVLSAAPLQVGHGAIFHSYECHRFHR